MRNITNTLFIVACCLFSSKIKSQVSIETFLPKIRGFVAANFSEKDMITIKKWSDSSYVHTNNTKHLKQLWYRGKILTKEGAIIEFIVSASELKAIDDRKTSGSILISHQGNCNVLICPILKYIPKYYMSFDTVKIIEGTTCSCDKIYLHFNNYSPSTNKVLESIDTSIIKLVKHEYFDFYFTDLRGNLSLRN